MRASDGYNHPQLEQLVNLAQSLYKVRVGVAHFGHDQVFLYTNSPYKGLDVLRFDINKKDEEIDLQGHIERLGRKVEEAKSFAKVCMLNYWVNENPDLEFSPVYERLLELAGDKSIPIKAFEIAMNRESEYSRLPVILQVLKQKVIQPIINISGKRKKKIVERPLEKGYVEVDESKIVTAAELNFTVDPVEYGKALMEKARPLQEKIDEEMRRKDEEMRNAYLS